MSYQTTAIEEAIWATLAALMPQGAQLIYANQDGPRPGADTFVTLLVIADQPRGLRTLEMSDVAGAAANTYAMRTGQQRTIQIALQAFGPDAYATLSRLVGLYEHPEVTRAAFDRGVSLIACGEMSRIPAALTSETEDRWTVTMTGAYHRVDALDTPALAALDADLELDGDDAGELELTL